MGFLWTYHAGFTAVAFQLHLHLFLKEENDSLRCQLEAYKNEVDLVKVDLKSDLQAKDEQINTYKQTLQGMQQVRDSNSLLPLTPQVEGIIFKSIS